MSDLQIAERQAFVADQVRFDAIEEFADLASSYRRSVAEAASRRERLFVEVHCRQVAAVTREAFAVAKSLGSSPDNGRPT